MILKKLYILLKKSKMSYLFFPKDVQTDVRLLRKDAEEYYRKKMLFSGALLLMGGVLFIGYLVWRMGYGASMVDKIVRPEAYEETVQVAIEAGANGDIFSIAVAPRMLSKAEADAQVQEIVDEIEYVILGANESLSKVTVDLNLPDVVEGYPFEIYWESDKEQIINAVGTVNRQGLVENEVVHLTASFYYMDWMWEVQLAACVQKEQLTEKENYRRELETLLQEQEKEQRMQNSFVLPQIFDGESVQYKRHNEKGTIAVLAGLLIVAAVAGWFGQDRDLHMAREKRRALFQEEYVSFISSLSMYISAGVTLQSAIHLCMADYVRRKPAEHLVRVALSDFCKDIQNGYSFSAAMERFSEKADDENYRKLAGILNQSVINGSAGLAAALEEEVVKVQEEKRRKSKVKGEQISTALIAPMMLQLGIVMALIMIPAFTSMQF